MKGPAPEQRILEAAIQCIERFGIEAVTTRRIAELAGVNSASINYYFRSKDALLERVLAATTENSAGDWQRLIDDPTLPPRERLRAILRELLEGQQKFPHLAKAHLHGPLMEGDFDTVFARRFRRFLARARDALAKELPARKADLEPRLAALFCAALGWGFLGGFFSEFQSVNPERPGHRAKFAEFLLQRFFPE